MNKIIVYNKLYSNRLNILCNYAIKNYITAYRDFNHVIEWYFNNLKNLFQLYRIFYGMKIFHGCSSWNFWFLFLRLSLLSIWIFERIKLKIAEFPKRKKALCVYDPCERMVTLLLARYISLSASSNMKIEFNPYLMISTFAHLYYLA